jgi:hypothetical protein
MTVRDLAAVPLFEGTFESERAPWDTGNTFAPCVIREGSTYRMWYGGQGLDGHDRIHYAESSDGVTWDRRGVVLEHPEDNLINDPCIVVVDGLYHCFYTVAHEWIVDTIHHATSHDGLRWERRGEVLGPGRPGEWDGLLVGRPAVRFEEGRWRMWFDARRAFPPGLGQGRWPEDPQGGYRGVGYAESADGNTWDKYRDNPLIPGYAGSVHVVLYRETYFMVSESRGGTCLATSPDGITWTEHGVWIPASGEDHDRYGHVTPFLFFGDDGQPQRLYCGLARSSHWTENLMGAVELPPNCLDQFL